MALVKEMFKAVFALEQDEWLWRKEAIQAIDVKFQLGAIRQANQSGSAARETPSGMHQTFSVIVFEMLSSENVDAVRDLDDTNLKILDMIRCAYFDSDVQFEYVLSRADEAVREALLEARRDAVTIGGLKTMFAKTDGHREPGS